MSGPDWKVLVPVEVLAGETVPTPVMELLSTLPVVVLGYQDLPEQTPPGQARMQFEEQAQAKLDELAVAFREAGGDSETRLVFTQAEEQTIRRVAEETGCRAFLIPNPTGPVERLLVPIRGEVRVDRIAEFTAALVGDRPIEITLFTVADSDGAVTEGQSKLDRAAETLEANGIPATHISTGVVVSETPIRTIAQAAAEHDAVVMGESAPSLRSFIFGDPPEEIAELSVGPVLVVRRPPDDSDSE